MRNFILLCATASAALSTVQSCNSTEEAFLNVDTLTLQFDNAGNSEELVTVESNSEWNVATDSPSWINVTKLNTATLQISVLPQMLEGAQRNGTVSVLCDGIESVEIEILQIAGFSIEGTWLATRSEYSTDLETWQIANNYEELGIEIQYHFDLQNNSVTMISKDDYSNDEHTLDIVNYDTENRTFTITDGSTEATYTISEINDSILEFYSWSEFSENYLKIHCEKAE